MKGERASGGQEPFWKPPRVARRFLELQKTFDMFFVCSDLLFDRKLAPFTVGPYPLGWGAGNGSMLRSYREFVSYQWISPNTAPVRTGGGTRDAGMPTIPKITSITTADRSIRLGGMAVRAFHTGRIHVRIRSAMRIGGLLSERWIPVYALLYAIRRDFLKKCSFAEEI